MPGNARTDSALPLSTQSMMTTGARQVGRRRSTGRGSSGRHLGEGNALRPSNTDSPETRLMPSQSIATDKPPGLKPAKNGRFVRLSVNLSLETAEVFRTLIERKGLSISEGIRRAIAVWKFLEDEKARGNEIAVVEPDQSVRKVVLL
jgi:Ribbon-helix-helix protein, copG family